jgi:hypothetical protein
MLDPGLDQGGFVTEYDIEAHIKTAAESGLQTTPLEGFVQSQPWEL